MRFFKTKLKDAYIIEIDKIVDSRGFFSRTWDTEIFRDKKLTNKIVQCSISFNKKKGTLRGMHYQKKPHQETKIVRCTRGEIFDVIIDLRSNSPTYKKWFGVNLSEKNHKMLYVPKGFAHGFLTLKNNTEVFYQISEFFKPEFSNGVRWDDDVFKIDWPLKPKVISKKDLSYKLFID